MAINREKTEAAALKLLQQGKFDKAILEFKKLIEDDPTDVRTLLKVGETYVKMGLKKESIETYERAASIYTEQGFFLKAVAVYKQALRVDAHLPDLHLKLAELYQQLGLANDALQHYQHVAIFYEQQGRTKDSLDVLKRMVELDPDNLPSRIKLAEILVTHQNINDAATELRAALDFLRTQQRFDDFVRVAERLVAIDVRATDIARELASIYMQRQQPSVALAKLQLCFKSDPRDVDTLMMIGQAFLEMQQVPKTVSVYKEVAKIHSTDGDQAKSRAMWQKVLELAGSDAEAEAALGLNVAPVAQARAPQNPATTMAPQAAAPAAPQKSGLDEQLARLMTETDVYMKYGLKDKAADHLKKVFEVKADYIPALEKFKKLQQPNSETYFDALHKLVAAAEQQKHPQLSTWKQELSAQPKTSPKPKSPPPPDDDLILLDEASNSGLPLDESIIDDGDVGQTLDDPSAQAISPVAARAPQVALPGAQLLASITAPLHNRTPLLDDDLPPDEAPLEPAVAKEIPRIPTGIMELPPLPNDEADALAMRSALQDLSDDDVVAAADFLLSDEAAPIEADDVLGTVPGNPPVASQVSNSMQLAESESSGFDDDDAKTMFMPQLGSKVNAFTPAAQHVVTPAPPVAPQAVLAPPDFLNPPRTGSERPSSQEARAVTAESMGVHEPSSEFDPADFDLPDDVKEMLRQQSGPKPTTLDDAPAMVEVKPQLAPVEIAPAKEDEPFEEGTRSKLGLGAKAQGFENDPANQFFPDELEEAEFFIQQELLDEAREILTAIIDDVPDSARVQWMLQRVDAKENGAPEPAAPWEQRILDEVQAQLQDLGITDEPTAAPLAESDKQVSMEEVLTQFKQKVAESIPAADAATHYELGNAYRDMGLLDEAISEFSIAAQNATRFADAKYLIGVTYQDQGRTEEAARAFEEVLASSSAQPAQRGASAYALGQCYEQLQRFAAALNAYRAAVAVQHPAPDLDRKVKTMSERVDASEDSTTQKKSERGKNIDYV